MDHFSRSNASVNSDDGSAARRPPAITLRSTDGTMSHITAQTPRAPPDNIQPPTVRIRRLPSASAVPQITSPVGDAMQHDDSLAQSTGGRKRSSSAPQRPQRTGEARSTELRRQITTQPQHLPSVNEEGAQSAAATSSTPAPRTTGRLRAVSSAARSVLPGGGGGRARASSRASATSSTKEQQEYDEQVVDLLDVVDPEVSTLTTLNNVQNSLFIPYLGNFLNRRPTYDLSRNEGRGTVLEEEAAEEIVEEKLAKRRTRASTIDEKEEDLETPAETTASLHPLSHSHTLTSVLSGNSIGHNYAVLPHGTVLDGWTQEDKDILNDHVRHMLHSRRAKFKRRMKAFGKYFRTPLGCFVTVYAFLLTFWGAAWVLFLIGWISVGDRQAYFVEICDQILTALFALVGLGLAPFRIVDTYHMIYIVHYHFLSWQLRRQKQLPDLHDANDLPVVRDDVDLELARAKSIETVVLTPTQQRKLVHHQQKFSKSHTFYKPHETFTHRAFSVRLLLVIVILLDCHSLFQMALGATTWGINYHHRPKALTAVILTCSICCNISGGITISIGDRRCRKKEIAEQMFRQALTETAMKKVEKKRKKEARKLAAAQLKNAKREGTTTMNVSSTES